MKKLVREKEKAIALRKKGLSYKEIRKQVPVAKSSLSLWLKDLPLTKAEIIVLKTRKDKNISQGRIEAAATHRKNRLQREAVIRLESIKKFQKYQHEPLFHTGIALYWAEGAKRQNTFHFMNSDETMIRVMLVWLERYADVGRNELYFRLYLHEPFLRDNWEAWWCKHIQVSANKFKKTIVKPSGLGVKKRPNYKGCLRIEVPRSSQLLLQMKFWIRMHIEYVVKQ